MHAGDLLEGRWGVPLGREDFATEGGGTRGAKRKGGWRGMGTGAVGYVLRFLERARQVAHISLAGAGADNLA